MNKLNNIVAILLATFGILGNNGYSDLGLSDWEVIDINSNKKSNDCEVISIETKINQKNIQQSKIRSKKEAEQYVIKQQLKNAMKNLYKTVENFSNDLQKKVDNFIGQGNKFINYLSKVRIKEVNYINTLSNLIEYNKQFIDELNDFKNNIQQYNESIKVKLNNIYKRNISNAKMEELIDDVVSEIVNKFEEHISTFDYLLNNKQNQKKTRWWIDLSGKDESYGDKINNVLQYINKPYFISNPAIQYIIKKSNEFVNNMIKENNEIQAVFDKEKFESELAMIVLG